jgi:hypothetical protein
MPTDADQPVASSAYITGMKDARELVIADIRISGELSDQIVPCLCPRPRFDEYVHKIELADLRQSSFESYFITMLWGPGPFLPDARRPPCIT